MKIPDFEPITIGCYTLTETGLEVRGKPTYDEHLGVGDFIRGVVKFSGFWLADWLCYGDTREDWKHQLDQVVDAGLLTEASARQYRYVGKKTKGNRVAGVDFGHHAEVASLDPAEQKQFLEKSKDEGWTQRELRQEIRAHKRTAIISGQAALEGMFRIIYADPPWKYDDSDAVPSGAGGKAERHYLGMSIEEICKLPVEAHALPHSTLFLWVTTPMLYQNPGPREVIEAWGFKYKSALIWDKVLGMPGHYGLHITHEQLIIATRGNGQPDVTTPQIKSIFVERRTDQHSEKPKEIRRWIMKHWTRGPYLELFGRQPVEGWSVFGNDARLWANDMERTA